MGVSLIDRYGFETVQVDIDFNASDEEAVTIPISRPFTEVVRGRLYIDTDPGASFAAWVTYTFYARAAQKGEDAFYRTAAKLVYTELAAATTGSDANIQPDEYEDFTPNDLVRFLDDDEQARLASVAATMVAEDNVGAHALGTGLVRVSEFSGFSLFNNEGGTDVYLKVGFSAVQTVSLKMELLLRR